MQCFRRIDRSTKTEQIVNYFKGALLAGAILSTVAGCGSEPIQTQDNQIAQTEFTLKNPKRSSKQELILGKISEAKKELEDERYSCSKKDDSELVWIAAYDQKKDEITYLSVVSKEKGDSYSQNGFKVLRKSVAGVNSKFEVSHPPGQIVLAIKICVEVKTDSGKNEIMSAIYTPYTKGIGDLMLANEGIAYLRQVVEEALTDLRKSGIDVSLFDQGVLNKDMIIMMVLNEHMEQVRKAGETPKEQDEERKFVKIEMARILTMVATNEKNAFSYSFSNKKKKEIKQARGLVQITKPTYDSLVKKYPEANLPENFFDAARDHKESVKAAILLFVSDYDLFYKNKLIYGKSNNEITQILFASYNCGGSRTVKAIKRHGKSWKKTHNGDDSITLEAERYLLKLYYVDQVLKEGIY